MAYEYDVFISYRRNPETRQWINDHFIPVLGQRLEFELTRKPRFYLDTEIEAGATWPIKLGKAIGASRTLISLWTKNYLASRWCTEELGTMVQRERKTKARCGANPYGLIIPAFIHDGETFPNALAHIQHFDITKCFNTRMVRNSDLAQELYAALATQAPGIAHCIESAPPWNPRWPPQAAKAFLDKFHKTEAPAQQSVPRFTAP